MMYAMTIKNYIEDAASKGKLYASDTCINRLQTIVNQFEENSMLIARMVYNSGKDVNDLGRYFSCRDTDDTRYIVFSLNGLPVGIYLGICGPVECTDADYNSMKPYLLDVGNTVLKALDIKQAYFQQNLTMDRFNFFDSQKENNYVHTLKPGHYITILIFSILIISLIAATVYEIIQRSKQAAMERLGIEEEPPRRKTI